MSFDLCICDACRSIRKSKKSIDLLRHTDVYLRKSWVMPSQCMCVWCIWVVAHAQRRCCHSVYMSKDCVMSLQCMCCNACKLIRKSKLINLLCHTDVYMHKSWVMSSQYVCVWCIWVATHAQRRCCRSVYMSKDCVVSSLHMWLWCM